VLICSETVKWEKNEDSSDMIIRSERKNQTNSGKVGLGDWVGLCSEASEKEMFLISANGGHW
jgi:hypothetical protein